MPLIPIQDFLRKVISGDSLLIDARSEGEFDHAHIPGAINLPLLNNEHRILVGTCFKQKGRDEAVRLGFELVGPLFASFVRKVDQLAKGKTILVYCWRGGMRSGIMSWILSMAGYKVETLKGGYKGFRNFALEEFKVPRKYAVVGGHTGCGKTDLLKLLEEQNHAIVDLEGLANHRGSAFGHLGMKAQPTNEQFENELAVNLLRISYDKIIWLEAESRLIGRIKIPDEFFFQLTAAPLFEITLEEEERVKRIEKDYAHFSKEELSACIDRIQKRLGGLRHKECLQALEEGRTHDWISILLEYYDKQYSHSTDSRKTNNRFPIPMKDRNDLQGNLDKMVALAENVIAIS